MKPQPQPQSQPSAPSAPSPPSISSSSSSSSSSSPTRQMANPPSFLGGAPSATHLVVLVHGLWGQPAHMHSIARSLRARHPPDDVFILCAQSIAGLRTYDGVAHGGERVCAEVEAAIAAQREGGADGNAEGKACGGFVKISFIGYSMGGLVARYVVGLLEAKGVLAGMECTTFATFATPHLGARDPGPNISTRLWNTMASSSIGEAGAHLFLHDTFRDTSRPLLAVMADPATVFVRGLRRFRRLTTYGNIINDRAVVWYTTAFSATDPFADLSKVAVRYEPGYEGVVLERGGGIVLREVSRQSKSGCTKDGHKDSWWRRGRKMEVKKSGQEPAAEGAGGGEDKSAPQEDETEPTFDSTMPWNMHLRMATFLGLFLTLWPVVIPIVGVGSSAAAVASKRRMHRHDEGNDGVATSTYRELSLWPTKDEGDAQPAQDLRPQEQPQEPELEPKLEPTTTSLEDAFPSLNLPAVQLEMINGLNTLPWRKYPVWIRRHLNTHEDMVVRDIKSEGTEGQVVLRHFAEEEFLA